MKVKDMLDVIYKTESVTRFRDIPLKRIKEFQEENLEKQIEFIEDKDYKDFYDDLQSIFTSRVNRPTAKKILNNAYILSVKKLNNSNTQ